MAESVLHSSEEKQYGHKLMRLIVDGGTEVLRNIFLRTHGGTLHTILSENLDELEVHRKKGIIKQYQWDKLYPPNYKSPEIENFDITLLCLLLRCICGLIPPNTGWNYMPSPTDKSVAANVVRIRLFRNNFFGHIPGTGISRSVFEARWLEVSAALVGLGLDKAKIDRLKAEECGEEDVKRVRREWEESDMRISSKLNDIENRLEKIYLKRSTPSDDEILAEFLHCYDFNNDIQSLCRNYTEGTRKWVFERIGSWLNTPDINRALIISGPAGMGKSIIAAVACKRFPEHFAACHFFQYNNSRYNNQGFFLQSLARQLCNFVPQYKQNLVSKLSGNKGKILDEMNVEGLSSMLFEEPFSNVNSSQHLLVVLDALDECREKERYKLVDLIAKNFHKLPSFIRFLITTRPAIDIAKKFEKLKPILLEPDDERNSDDVKLFVENRLRAKKRDTSLENVSSIVENSGGLMIQASFLCELSGSPIKDFPGREEVYESYFDRLEKELHASDVGQDKFLLLLSVIALAKEPLPLPILYNLFSDESDSLSSGRKLLRLESRVSLLFDIKDGEYVSINHKSIKDWLVQLKPKHNYSINEKRGHETLACICVAQMEKLKENKAVLPYDSATKYALKYGIPHILEADPEVKNVQLFSKLLDCASDLEVVHVSVCVDVYETLDNFISLPSNTYNILSEKTSKKIKTLTEMIRKFLSILKDNPRVFLRYVEKENMAELSAEASELLRTKYRKLEYYHSEVQSNVTKMTSRKEVACVDILESDIDYLACGYKNGEIELFSLSDFDTLWVRPAVPDCVLKSVQSHEMIDSLYGIPRFVVFHPIKNEIFPGQLDLIFNLEGKLSAGPLKIPTAEQSQVQYFTNCCFSTDKEKMATHYADRLTVWNLVKNERITSIECQEELYSLMFSFNGHFLATTDSNGLNIYNYNREGDDYTPFSKKSEPGHTIVLISTFNSDSWFVWRKTSNPEREYTTVTPNLTVGSLFKGFRLLPMNASAARLWEGFLNGDGAGSLWPDILKDHNVFSLGNGKVLATRYEADVLALFTPSRSIHVPLPRNESSSSTLS